MSKEAIIVVPCFNEERRLSIETFKAFMGQNPHIQFLFVNDGSTDHTSKLINNIDGALSLDLPQNSGKAEAVRAGIIKAISLNPKFVGFWDADLATPLEEINSLLKYPQEIKVRMCSRVKRLGGYVVRKPSRHVFGRIFATIVSLMLDLPVYDSQCGAKIFEAGLATKLFKDSFTSKWFFDVEILYRVKLAGEQNHTLLEHPVSEWKVKEGSKLTFLEFLKTPIELLKIYFKYS
jgi:dolichyl-phosphate beta-glucosyltransferase